MRKPLVFIFFAAGVLSSLAFNCGGSESKQTSQATLLSGDLSAVLTSLQSLAGAAFQTTTTEHFILVHEAGTGDIANTGKVIESAYQRFYRAFAEAGFELSRSEGRLVWICFPQQSGFNRYALRAEGMDLSWLDGYYSTLTNRVAVVQPNLQMAERERVGPAQMGEGSPRGAERPSGAGRNYTLGGRDMRITLAANRQSEKVLPMAPAGQRVDVTRVTHELAHQLAFNSGLQKRGVMYPVWVSEGLATNFETSGWTDAGVISPNAGRCDCLAAAYAAGEMIPLRQLVVQTRVPADAHASRQYYAQTWAFFRFLLAERPEGLRRYLSGIARLPAGRRDTETLLSEFMEAFGAPHVLEPAWNAFVFRETQSDES